MYRSGTVACLLTAALVLAAPAAATSKVKLRSVGAPPASAAPGSAFTLRGTLVNSARSTQRPRVTVSLRTVKGGFARKLGTSTLRRVRAGRTLRFSIRVKVPATLRDGRYYLRLCTGTSCRYTARRLTVRKPATPAPPTTPPTTAPAPAPSPSPTPTPSPTPEPEPVPEFDVLVFTKTAGEYKPSTEDATAAIRAIGRERSFTVTETDDARAFTEANLKRYRAVVLLNTAGDILTHAQQTAFERYYTEGGGVLAVSQAIKTEPSWTFLSDVLGARATASCRRSGARRSRSPTAVMRPAGTCRSTGATSTATTTTTATSAGSRT
jgi:hypothetical protein